jgi:hypothetical protein
MDQLCGRFGGMFWSSRSRIMIAALVFALGWALGAAAQRTGATGVAILCLATGSIALAYLVWEYHKAWRLRPLGPHPKLSVGFKSWSGLAVNGLIIRPEYLSAALALLICVIGIYEYIQVSSRQSAPIPQSPPALLLPETRPLQ